VNSASELFQRTYDPSFTAQHAIDTTGSQYRVAEAEAKLALAGSQDTKAQFTGSDGKYVPERQAIHDDLLNRTFTDANIIAAIPKDGEQKTFYVLGGRGGSGKSWFSDSPDAPFDASKTITINTDDYKAELPEFEGWNAALVHEESSDIAERAHDIARDRGLNVTFDATLKSPDTITRLVNGYEKAGYRIEGYFMHTAPQVSAVRALNRFNKPNPGQALSRKNRYVPPSYVLKSVNNEKVFDSLTPRFAKYGIYDNNSGNGPKLVKSGGHN
jgi:hypothetical protein